MNWMVFGAGAVGSVVAARLAEVAPVSVVARPEHVRAIRDQGLRITGETEMVQRRLDAVTVAVDAAAVPDVVLLTVKAYDTVDALAALAPFTDHAVFVSLQNGLGNEEIIAARARRVLGAVINQGATFVRPGEVFHAGSGDIAIGPFAATEVADAEAIAGSLAAAGFPAFAVTDICERVWAKTILNAAVNPISALLRRRTGELLESAALREAMRQVVEESVAIAAACGIDLIVDDLLESIERVARATADNKSSMYQDLEKGGRTEIDAINGALVERAREHAVTHAANELLVRMVRAAEGE